MTTQRISLFIEGLWIKMLSTCAAKQVEEKRRSRRGTVYFMR
jgi:hypothetical protein